MYNEEQTILDFYIFIEIKGLEQKEETISGNWSAFREFENGHLNVLSEALRDLAGSENPLVLMSWTPWSACGSCRQGIGQRRRRGSCRISAPIELQLLPFNLNVFLIFLSGDTYILINCFFN